ncbi:MAG: ATP-binding protein [Anaerolineae bacterium]
MEETSVYELTVPARFDNLALIGDFISGVARRAGFDEKGVFNLQLACDEACTNVIEHAYGGGPGQIRITVTLYPDRIQIQVHDTGRPFDPQAIRIPDLEAPLERRETGGLGLHFMRSIMDELRFEFGEDGNRLTMVKRRTP